MKFAFLPSFFLGAVAVSCDGATPPPVTHPRIIWQVPIEGTLGATLRPSFDSTAVYFGDEDHRIFQIVRRDGRRGWTTQNNPVGGPGFQLATGSAVAGPVVAVPDAYVFGLNTVDGTLRWRSPVICFSHTPATDGQTIFAGCGDGRIFAFDGSTGATRWEARVADDTGGVIFNPVLHRDTLYVGFLRRTNPFTGGVGAIDANTGSKLWYREFEPGTPGSATSSHGNVKIVDDVVVAASDGGEIYTLERSTGVVRWKAARLVLPSQAINDDRPLAAVGERVIAGSSSGTVIAYNASTGAILWEKTFAGSIVEPFASDDRSVFVVNAGGQIMAIDASSGTVNWTFGSAVDERMLILGTPALRGDTVFVGAAKSVFALRAYIP